MRGNGRPLVSVIMPAFNAERFIEAAIRSVLVQTFSNFELIVVDDGSTDATSQIVDRIAMEDARIRRIAQANAGVAAARNRAIEASRGALVAPIDADDVWYPRKLEKQVHCLQAEGGEVGMVYVWSRLIDEHDQPIREGNGDDVEGRCLMALVYANVVGNASTPLIRRECLDAVGGYSTELARHGAFGCEDYDLYLRIAELFELRVVRECLVDYRRAAASMSRDVRRMERSRARVMAGVRQRHTEIPAVVFRWSDAYFFLYLARESGWAGRHGLSAWYLIKAVSADRQLLTWPGFLLSVCRRAVSFTRRSASPQPPNASIGRLHRSRLDEIAGMVRHGPCENSHR